MCMGDIKSNMSKLIYESRGDRDLHCTESQSEASTEEGHTNENAKYKTIKLTEVNKVEKLNDLAFGDDF